MLSIDLVHAQLMYVKSTSKLLNSPRGDLTRRRHRQRHDIGKDGGAKTTLSNALFSLEMLVNRTFKPPKRNSTYGAEIFSAELIK